MAFLSPERFSWIARKRREAYKRIFECPEGETVLADLMGECGWSKDLFNENPYVTANLCGRRHMILHIKAVLNQTDEQLEAIIERQFNRQENYPK